MIFAGREIPGKHRKAGADAEALTLQILGAAGPLGPQCQCRRFFKLADETV